MYDEVVKRLRDAAKMSEALAVLLPNSEGKATAKLYKEAADAIEELQQTVEHYKGCSDDWYKEACDYKAQLPRWIPVTERLPEAGERVLCYCRANIYEVMKMRTSGDWVYDVHHIYMHSFVTHWMPLPQPPKEE